MIRTRRMLLMAFVLPLLAVGVPFWNADPGSAGATIPGALLWWPLVLVFFGAVASRLAGAGFVVAWLVAAAPLPLLVLARALAGTGTTLADAALAAGLALVATLLGALAGHAALRGRAAGV